jgi:hypothetical protein
MKSIQKKASSNTVLGSKRNVPETNSSEVNKESKEITRLAKAGRRKVTPKEMYSPKPFAETRCIS